MRFGYTRAGGEQREGESVKTQTSNSQSGIPRDTKKGTLTVAERKGGYAYVNTGNRGDPVIPEESRRKQWDRKSKQGIDQ